MKQRHDPQHVAHLRHRHAAKWVMVAAAAALVVGAVTAAVLLNNDDGGPASSADAAGQPVITGTALPKFDSQASTDAAAGLPAPSVTGRDIAGSPVVIDPAATGQPVLLVFVANWCPHCHRLLPNIQAWLADGTIGIDVTVIPTAESSSAPSSASWLADLGWTGSVLPDGDNGDGRPGPVAIDYGASGWPYVVLLDRHGAVTARASGELNHDQMIAILATLG